MRKFIITAFGMLTLAGCYKDSADKLKRINGVKWSGTYAVPAANIDLGIDDATSLSRGLISLGSKPDGLMYMAFEKTVRSSYGKHLVLLNDQNFSLPGSLSTQEKSDLTGNSMVVVNRNASTLYNQTDELDSILYLSGDLQVEYSHTYLHAATAVITFPDIIKNGQPLTATLNVNANSSSDSTINLTDCKWNLTNSVPGFNHVRYSVATTYTNSGNGFGGGENFKVSVNIKKQQFKRVWGYFNAVNLISATDSVSLDVFETGSGLNISNVYFENPNIQLFYTNELGVECDVQTSQVYGTKSGSAPQVISGFPISKTTGAAGAAAFKDSVEINSSGSNVKTVINNRPRYITFQVDASSKPGSKLQRHTIDRDARLAVKVWVELPFQTWIGSIEAMDTTDLTLDLDGADKYIDWVDFRVEYNNQIPLELEFQGFFADSSGKVLDSLFSPFRNFADAATINSSGAVINATHDVYEIKFDRNRIAGILDARKLIFHVSMRTARFNSGLVPVRLTKDQRFTVKLGVHTKISANETF